MSHRNKSTRWTSEKKETIDELFSTMDTTIIAQEFDQIQTDDSDELLPKAITQADMAQAAVRYNAHQHSIQDELMKKGKENDPDFVAQFKNFQLKSDEMLQNYGSAYNDIISLDSRCQRELGEVFVTASARKLKTNEDFNWVQFKENIRKHLKVNCRKFRMSNEDIFLNGFPTALFTSRHDKRLNGDFPAPERTATQQSNTQKTPKVRRNYRQELNKNTETSQPTLAVNKEDDSELLFKLEKRIIEVEKQNGRRPMPMVKLACDPTSFQNTVENFAKLSFLLQQGTLLYFIENDEKMVISRHNAKKTGLQVEKPNSESHHLHYDVRTFEYWIEKFDVRENLLKNL